MALDDPISQPRWFRGGKASNDKLLRSHSDTSSQYENLKESVRSIVGRKNVDGKVKHSKEEIEQQIQELDYYALKELGQSNLQDSKFARLNYLEERRGGIKHFGSGLQKCLNSFSNYLTAYSGIVEVVKQAGQPYGEVAYGALSLLLIVAVNKSANEDKITRALDDLCRWYPRLNDLTDIYPEPKLEACVASVYKEGIAFAQSSVTYYTSSPVRFSMSVKSSKTELDAAIAAIEKSLAEVHFESRILLHKAVRSINGQNHQLLRGNEELKQGNEDLKRQIEELKLRNDELKKEVQVLCQKASNKQIQEDWESLQRFKTLLDVPDEDPSPEVDLDYCQKTLEKAFRKGSPNVRSSSSFSRMTLNALEEDEVYNRWMSNSHSSLFVISGRTKPESHDGHNTCSWLSMASIDVAEKLRADGSFTLFYSCHPKLRADDIIPFQAPLSMLIYQALTHRPELLRYENQHLQSLIRQWQKESHDREKLTLMIKTLRECLASATVNPQKPMYIILDRMDLCDGTKALKRHFLRQLLSLVTDDSLNLKLMLVLDSTLWEGLDDLFDDLLDDLRYDAKDRLLGKLGWHQTEQTPRLSSPEWV